MSTPSGYWAQPKHSGRGSFTPHFFAWDGTGRAVCGRHRGYGLWDYFTPYGGDRRCQRCAAWVARQAEREQAERDAAAPSQNSPELVEQARVMAQATGSRAATVRVERRTTTGELVTEAVASWERHQ
jgi:hypothetical protein